VYADTYAWHPNTNGDRRATQPDADGHEYDYANRYATFTV
jgi:hypothetical protein